MEENRHKDPKDHKILVIDTPNPMWSGYQELLKINKEAIHSSLGVPKYMMGVDTAQEIGVGRSYAMSMFMKHKDVVTVIDDLSEIDKKNRFEDMMKSFREYAILPIDCTPKFINVKVHKRLPRKIKKKISKMSEEQFIKTYCR